MPTISSTTLDTARQDGFYAKVYGSPLVPDTLWSARINDAGAGRGTTAIVFDTGSGSSFGFVEALQEVWVGTSAGAYDVARLRIRSISSGDGGVTGTVTVAQHPWILANDQYLTFKHDYPVKPLFPFIESNGVFKKDKDVAYGDQNTKPPPVVVCGPHRVAELVSGTATVNVDASASYAVASGASISSYALSVAPTTGVTVTFSSSTGTGDVAITNAGNYWFKFSVTDSNGKTQSSYRWVRVHNMVPGDADYPLVDFDISSFQGDKSSKGYSFNFIGKETLTISDIPDKTLFILWHKPVYGSVIGNGDPVHKGIIGPTSDLVVFHNPQIVWSVSGTDLIPVLTARVTVDGAVPAAGYAMDIEFTGTGCTGPQTDSITTSAGGYISASVTLTSCSSTGTLTAAFNSTTITTQAYDFATTRTADIHALSLVNDGVLSLCTGYVSKESIERGYQEGAGQVEFEIISPIDNLRRYDFSVSLEAVSGVPATWYEYEDWLTVGRAVHHLWKWHSTLLETTDVIGLTDDTDLRAYSEFEDGNLADMADGFAAQRGIRANVVCDKNGRIRLTPDVQLLRDSDRSALPTVFDITDQDRLGKLIIRREPRNRTAFVFTSGFSWDGTFTAGKANTNPICSTAPGAIPADEGANVLVMDRQTFQDQTHANEIAGRFYAQVNNEYPGIPITFSGAYIGLFDVLEPEFYSITIQTVENERGLAITKNLICRNITVDFDLTHNNFTVQASFEAEQAAQAGVTGYCLDSVPTLGGALPTIAADPPGGILTAGSVEYLKAHTKDWVQRSSDSTLDMVADPWWAYKAGTPNSSSAIVVRGGTGYIKRSTDGGQTWSTVTPATNPPNTAGDSPAPTAATVDYEIFEGSFIDQDAFIVVVNWVNSSLEERSWLYYTTDNFSTGSWLFIGETSCANPGTAYNLTGFSTPGNGSAYRTSGELAIIQLDTNLFVALSGIGAMAIEVNATTREITHGSAAVLPSTSSSDYICKCTTTKFAVAIRYNGAGTGTVNPATVICDVNPSTLAITVGSAQGLRTTYEEGTALNSDMTSQGSDMALVCPDGSNLTVIFFGDKLSGACATGNYGYYVMTGSISSRTVTWPDTTCSGNTIRDLTDLYLLDADLYTSGANHGKSFLIDMQDGSTWCFAFRDPVNVTSAERDLYVVHGSGSTLTGTPVAVGVDDYTVTEIHRGLVRLDSTHAVLVFTDDSNIDTGWNALFGCRLTLGGGGITVGAIQTLWDQGNVATPDNHSIIALDSNEFALVWVDSQLSYPACTYAARYTTSGDTISETALCGNWIENETSSADLVVAGWDADEFIEIDDPGTPLRARIINKTDIENSCTTADIRGLGIDFTQSTGLKVWVTACNGVDLELLEITLSGLTINNRYDLGAATFAEVDARTYWAFPRVLPGSDSTIYVHGRMSAPQALSDPCHIIRTTDSGSSFLEVETAWASDFCGSLVIVYGEVFYALRCSLVNSKLYGGTPAGTTLLSTLPYLTWTHAHSMQYSFVDGAIIVGAANGQAIMVVGAIPPYYSWVNLTYDHPTASGIRAVVLL